MSTTAELIHRLKTVTLNTDSQKEVRELLQALRKFGLIELRLHPTNEFIRARTLKDNETVRVVRDLSYCPNHLNTTYQRASTQNKTMFYSVLVQPEFTPNGFLAMGRATSLLESWPLMRDKSGKGIQKIAYGKWTNTRDMRLAAIVYNDQFAGNNPKTEMLHEAFKQHVQQLHGFANETLTITGFLADEYSKEPIPTQYDYMISAIFTEIAVEKGFDGVLYPSVRTAGQGLNVAITPDFVDRFMELRAAGECIVLKNGEITVVLNDTVAIIPRGQNDLKLRPFDDPAKLEAEKKYEMKRLGL
jgi:hypothetical protein